MQTVLLGVALALLSVISWPTPSALAEDTKVARGTVVAIAGSSLSVKVGDQEMRFAVDSKTEIEARGAGTKTRAAQASGRAGVKLDEVLKVGQGVAVTYYGMTGQLHASVVRAVSDTSASGGNDAAKPVSAPKPESMTANGTVQSVGANSLTIAGGGGGGSTYSQTFVVDEHTRVFAKGAGTAAAAKGGRVPFGELIASGDRVNVTYHKVGERLHAGDVHVTMKAMH